MNAPASISVHHSTGLVTLWLFGEEQVLRTSVPNDGLAGEPHVFYMRPQLLETGPQLPGQI
jgi:hypothetical protein